MRCYVVWCLISYYPTNYILTKKINNFAPNHILILINTTTLLITVPKKKFTYIILLMYKTLLLTGKIRCTKIFFLNTWLLYCQTVYKRTYTATTSHLAVKEEKCMLLEVTYQWLYRGLLISNIDIAIDTIDNTFEVSISISTILTYKNIDRGIDDTFLVFFIDIMTSILLNWHAKWCT